MCLSARPIFTNDNSLIQYGEFGNNVDINVYVYSKVPKYIVVSCRLDMNECTSTKCRVCILEWTSV
jgi:hypothetical protein